MYNKYLTDIVINHISSYRDLAVADFYNTCNKVHTKIAIDVILTAKSYDFEREFSLSYNYNIQPVFFYNYTGEEIANEGLFICISYVNEENNQYTNIDISDNKLNITLNTYYYDKADSNIDNTYMNDIKDQLLLLQYCSRAYIHIDNKQLYIDDLNNDLINTPIDMLLILHILLLMSPSEITSRKKRIKEDIDVLSVNDVNRICYKKRGIDRLCALINYTIESNYYNYYLFLLNYFHIMKYNDTKRLIYLGYYLTKLGIKDFLINIEYVRKILDIRYMFTRTDKVLVNNIYEYLSEYFCDYIYDIMMIIDKIVSTKGDI